MLWAFPMKISWLRAKAWAPQTAEDLTLRVLTLNIFYNLCLPVICQKERHREEKTNNTFLQLYSKCTAPGRLVCSSREEDSYPHCVSVVLCHLKQKAWCCSPVCQHSKKTNTTPTESLMKLDAFLRSRRLVQRQIIHHSWSHTKTLKHIKEASCSGQIFLFFVFQND